MFKIFESNHAKDNFRLWSIGILCFLALDQLTKFWARTNLPLGESVSAIPRVLDLRLLYNTGAAFSFMSGKTAFLAMFSLLVSVGLIFFALQKLHRISKVQIGFFVFITAGALGNLIDRLCFHKVTDFIDLLLLPGNFPVFNLADTYINISLVFLVFDYFLSANGKLQPLLEGEAKDATLEKDA